MRSLIFLLFAASILFSQPDVVKVKTGIEVLRENNFNLLEGKRIGLVTNPTGVDRNLKSTIDILFEADNVNLTALYGPEHGVRGSHEAGEYIKFYTDAATGLPVYSLYGKTREPDSAMLANVDALVYDIQDIGCRSYTYISTMGKIMEAAVKFGKEIIVLDRPNPLGGKRIEGSLVEDGYFSFVSQFKIPYVYGLTSGELAIMLNNEKMLKNGVRCNLKVVRMEGWTRDMTFMDTGLPWVPTSPHVPHATTPFYYVATGILGELQVCNIGVGYTFPFETMTASWIDAARLAEKMNSYELEGVIFRPVTYKPYYSTGKGEYMKGVQIHFTDYNNAELMPIQFLFVKASATLFPEKNIFDFATEARIKMFNKVIGSNKAEELLSGKFTINKLKKLLNEGVDEFRNLTSSKYFLY